MRILSTNLCLLVAVCFVNEAWANNLPAVPEPKQQSETMLVYDIVTVDGKLRNYRSSSDCARKLEECSGINLTGLADVHMSGSAQFSKHELPHILKGAKGKVYIVDLRQESHGFINDKAFTLFSYRNRINANKTNNTIYTEENNLLAELALTKQLTLHKIKKIGDGYFKSVQDFPVLVEKVASEQELVEQFGLAYKRLYVLDRHKPRDLEVDEFLLFVRSLPKDAWLHFHCRGGKGRTTTFMAMYDILHNAKKVSLEDILARQLELGGAVLEDAPLKPPSSEWTVPAAKKRYKFITAFYKYVLAADGLHRQKWSAWVNTSTD